MTAHTGKRCNIRHKRGSDGLEEERDSGVKASEVCAETEAEGQYAGEEGDDGEEQGDNVEREHKAAQVIELVRANELRRNVVLGAEVVWRVEGQRRLCAPAVRVASILLSTKREESPPCRVAKVIATARDAAGGGLEEVGISDRASVDGSRKDHEEREDNSTGEDDQCYHPEERTFIILSESCALAI